jgi:2-succinyl-6-hydroxy-2,4-cyclohexadiene-1-carboxylate synthase
MTGSSDRLHVEVSGSGPALMLVNGARCTVRQWDAIIDELNDRHTVIRHDVRGTGRSAPAPHDSYRFETYASDIIALASDLGFKRFDLWGMAWGARVALVTAALNPGAVNRLMLSDLAVDPVDHVAQKAGSSAARQARDAAGVAHAPKPDGAFDHDHPDELLLALGATKRHLDLMAFVRQVRCPTLVATGEFDPNLTSSRRALTGLADGQLEVLPLTAHASVLQRPELVLSVATDFFVP